MIKKYKYQTVLSNYYKYSDVNKDPKLREMMVTYYKKKLKNGYYPVENININY